MVEQKIIGKGTWIDKLAHEFVLLEDYFCKIHVQFCECI